MVIPALLSTPKGPQYQLDTWEVESTHCFAKHLQNKEQTMPDPLRPVHVTARVLVAPKPVSHRLVGHVAR